MAGSYLYKDQEERLNYIADVFNTLIVRDISKKYKIHNKLLMDRLVDFLMDNISNQTERKFQIRPNENSKSDRMEIQNQTE